MSLNTVLDYLEQAINDAGSYLSYIQRIPFMLKRKDHWDFMEDIDRIAQKEIRSDERMMEKISGTLKDLRTIVLTHYGRGKVECVCCGEKQFDFLTLDHVNNDGYQDKRYKNYDRRHYYKYLIRHNFPSNLQTFCWNCNCGKARNDGVCPHSEQKILN